jgi:hypothetical protein
MERLRAWADTNWEAVAMAIALALAVGVSTALGVTYNVVAVRLERAPGPSTIDATTPAWSVEDPSRSPTAPSL